MARSSQPTLDIPSKPAASLTQRAYTLRLRGADPQDNSWRDALWATHEAINKGTKVFGDWLLTLRGGLSHELAETLPSAKGKKRTDEETAAIRKNCRILLALSWLSVESELTTEDQRKQFVVAGGQKVQTANGVRPANYELALRTRLRDILRKRGVPDSEIGDPGIEPENQPSTWLGDCGPSLAARIRDDAVWVNRSGMFDALTDGWDKTKSRDDAHTLLSFILSANKDDFLELPAPKKPNKKDDEPEEDAEKEERQKALKASSKGAGQRTRHPFSHLLGEGKPFGKPTRSLDLRPQWHDVLKQQLEEATKIPIAPVRQKGAKKDKNAGPAHTEIQREMFSKAASRVAQIVTKQRQQEADRLARKAADKDLVAMEADTAFDPALAALKTCCDEYRIASGAAVEFRIRPAQITGWPGIVRRWAAIKESDPEKATEARIQAVKDAQDADEEKKFGDANLFFRLAEERFAFAWRLDSKTDATILERFVKGMKARSDSERLKVAAYRHPDPYLNPIFCQFGVSRPPIHFRRLKAFTNAPAGNDPRAVGMLLWHPAAQSAKVTLMHAVSRRLDHEIGSACGAVQEGAHSLPEIPRRGRLGAAAGGLPSVDSPSRVAGVFDLKEVKGRTGEDVDEDDGNEVGKLKEPKWNGTLSARRRELVAIRKLIDKGDTQRANPRRDQLRWTLTVSMEMEGCGPWFRYVATAENQTPFVRTVRKDKPKDNNDWTKGLAEQMGNKRIEAEGWPWQEFNEPLIEKPAQKRKSDERPSLIVDSKAKRGDKACLILSRLPGLRVLSVDLGHRFAAACAVWETLSRKQFEGECGEARRKEGSRVLVSDLYATIEGSERESNRVSGKARAGGRIKRFRPTTLYRRIGPDKLPDSSDHPAPWARLDRQFLIKLQGEEAPARKASSEEINAVRDMETQLGHLRDKRNPLPMRVDELMAEATRTIRLALRRHGDAAKIAFGVTSDYKPMPGDQKFWFTKAQDNDKEPTKDAEKKSRERAERHTEYLQDMLCLWHELAVSSRWQDEDALKRWNEDILPLIQQAPFTEPPPLEVQDANDNKKIKQRDEKTSRWKKAWSSLREPLARRSEDEEELLDKTERKAGRETLRALLLPVAESLRTDPDRRKQVAGRWADRWSTDDKTWGPRLKQSRRWILPRGLRARQGETDAQTHARKARLGTARNVGGLSLTRIATIRELWQVQKAYRYKAKPDDLRAGVKLMEEDSAKDYKFGDRALQTMERLREQRVKQIASRIAASALGLGGHWKDVERRDHKGKSLLGKDGKPRMKRVWVEGPDAKYPACHAVVIENLRNYRPDELQTRRENRALMNWSAGKVRKYLEEACQLHGLHLREVMPNYTSRQCSRTGLPGVRCTEVPVWEFLTKPWWRKRVKDARERQDTPTRDKPFDAEARMFVELDKTWPDPKDKPESEREAYKKTAESVMPLRLIAKGGDLFVAAPTWDLLKKHGSPCVLKDCPTCTILARATQADLNAAANIGLRALLDPDFLGRWWYVPCDSATGNPAKDKCAGAACIDLDKALIQPEKPDSEKKPSKKSRGGEKTNAWRDVASGDEWRIHPHYWNDVKARAVASLLTINGLEPAPRDSFATGDPPW